MSWVFLEAVLKILEGYMFGGWGEDDTLGSGVLRWGKNGMMIGFYLCWGDLKFLLFLFFGRVGK